jgi:hypothetical protein
MADERERSRSPDPPAADAEEAPAPAPADNGGHNGAPVMDSADPEGVKLYVGNLDYGTCFSSVIRMKLTVYTPLYHFYLHVIVTSFSFAHSFSH